MFDAIDHVVLVTRNLVSAGARTARLLDRSPSWSGEQPGAGTGNQIFRLDNTCLELLAPVGRGPLAAALEERLASAGEGVFALALRSADVAGARIRLAERGLEPGPIAKGIDRDVESGAFREWQSVALPAARTRGLALSAIQHHSPPELLPQVAPLGDPSAAPHAIDHVVVRSADADASRRLFGDALGLRLALDRSFEAYGFRGLFFRVGGATVEVAGPLVPEPGASAPDTFSGLAWRVADVPGAQRRLAAAGFDVSPVRSGRKPGTLVCTVRSGTCGVPTLLVGPAPDA